MSFFTERDPNFSAVDIVDGDSLGPEMPNDQLQLGVEATEIEKPQEYVIGVAGVLRYKNQVFVVPLLSEDAMKFEVALNPELQPLIWGYLANSLYGTVSGKVEDGEELLIALQREALEEFSELLQGHDSVADAEEVLAHELSVVLAGLHIGAFAPAAFTVLQVRRDASTLEHIPRGWFKFWVADIELTDAAYQVLQPHLHVLQSVPADHLRPSLQQLLAHDL